MLLYIAGEIIGAYIILGFIIGILLFLINIPIQIIVKIMEYYERQK